MPANWNFPGHSIRQQAGSYSDCANFFVKQYADPMKPYSEACDQNRGPILAALKEELADSHAVLEIGSGTGQHAVYFGEHLPHLSWQTSDIDSCHPGINAWLEAAQLPNIFQPLSLDVSSNRWPNTGFDGVFSANTTCHSTSAATAGRTPDLMVYSAPIPLIS
jgi:hypothetical protein